MGTSTAASTARNRKGPLWLQPTCFCSSTPSPRLSRSKVSVMDLRRAPARCSIRPVHRSKLQVAVCSRDDASHGLFLMSPCRPGKTPESAYCGFRSRRRPLELPYAPESSCTAQPRAHGSKYHLNPSSWARAVPVSHLRLASCSVRPARQVLQLMCSSRCSSSVRVLWKMTFTREVESLAARHRLATAHDLRI